MNLEDFNNKILIINDYAKNTLLKKINKLLNISSNTITNFSIKEAILKLNGDVFKNINNYDINDYHIISHYIKKYIIICVYHKYMIK